MSATLFAACFMGLVCRAAGASTATLTSTTESSTVTLTSTTVTSTTESSTTTLTTTTMTSTTTLTSTTVTSTTESSTTTLTDTNGQSSTEISTSTMVTETTDSTTATTGPAMTPASKVEGSITLAVADAAAASQLVTDERVAEGWRLAIADVAGVSPEYVQLTVAVQLTAKIPLGRRLRKLTSAATIVVSYVIIVPAASEEEATAVSSSVVASISSKSAAGLTETIAQRVSEATGVDSYDMVVQLIEVPTSSTVLQLVQPTTTTTTVVGSLPERARSSAFSRRALCLGQALLAAVLTASMVW